MQWPRGGRQSGAEGLIAHEAWQPCSSLLHLGKVPGRGLAEGAGAERRVPEAQGRQSKSGSPQASQGNVAVSLSLPRLLGGEGARILLLPPAERPGPRQCSVAFLAGRSWPHGSQR